MGQENRQEALERLLDLAAVKGFVTFDDIYDCSCEFGLSFGSFDWLSENIATRNVIIYDEAPNTVVSVDDDYDDYAQTDFEEIFQGVIEAEPNLKPLIEEIRNIKPPQWGEVGKLKYQVKEGNAYARQRMIEMYMRIAVRIAFQRAIDYDTDLEETIGDAFIGLILAVDKYDPDHSGPFVSYASMWIFQNIQREQTTKNPQVYFPVHKKEKLFLVYPMLKKYGCIDCPDFNDCAKATQKIMERTGCTKEQVTDIIRMIIPLSSIDEYYQELERSNEKQTLSINSRQYIYDGEECILEQVSFLLMKEQVMDVLDMLTPREEKVLRLRYGFDDGKERTLEEVGKIFNLTRERIRQIEKKALRKLKHPSRSKRLSAYVE